MFTAIRLFCVIFSVTVSTGYCQQMTYDNGGIIQHIINIEGVPATDLYKGVDRWILKTYKSPDKVVTARIENEEIRGNGFESSAIVLVKATNTRNDFRYSFKIEVKDNRVRYTMYDMRAELYGIEAYIYKKDGTEKTSGQAKSVKASAEEVASGLINSLEGSLKQKEAKGADW